MVMLQRVQHLLNPRPTHLLVTEQGWHEFILKSDINYVTNIQDDLLNATSDLFSCIAAACTVPPLTPVFSSKRMRALNYSTLIYSSPFFLLLINYVQMRTEALHESFPLWRHSKKLTLCKQTSFCGVFSSVLLTWHVEANRSLMTHWWCLTIKK